MIPASAATPLKPVITSSRAIMTKATQAATLSRGISMIRAATINTLSAKGSISLPSTVSLRIMRAT